MYQPIEPQVREGTLQLESKVLNLYLKNEGNSLRFYEVSTGKKLLTQDEAEDELTRLRTELDQLKKQLGASPTDE
jgi:hypothetical protein